jgi:glyoxylase-like metal-dependent hydrolase (beta-lactamase superfamily II)
MAEIGAKDTGGVTGVRQLTPALWQVQQELAPGIPLNVHLVVGDYAALIDTGLPSTFPYVERLLAEAGVDRSNVKLILNTHAHHDHAGADRLVKEMTGALVGAPLGAVPWIEDHDLNYREFALHHPDVIPDSPELRAELSPTLTGGTRVDLIIDEGVRVRPGRDVELVAYSVPGHMHAELAYYERFSRVMIIGDAVTGTDWPIFHGHLVPSAYRATLARLRQLTSELPIETVVLAHYAEPYDAEGFLSLLSRAELYVASVDEVISSIVREADRDISLADVWKETSKRMNRQSEFRGLAMVAAHLEELVESGRARLMAPDTVRWIL